MNMKKIFPLFALTLFISCGEKKEITHLPVQAEQEGRWGMVTTDGDVVFEGVFENEPGVPHRERFLVPNKDELLEFYTVEKEPRKIGKPYRTAMDFVNEVTAVAEPDSVIKLIDPEGEVVLRLDQLNGKPVERVTDAGDGVFIYVDATESYGCFNTKGEVLIPAEYEFLSLLGDGCILGKPKSLLSEETRREPYWIMNLQGEKLGEVDMMKYDGVGTKLVEGKYLPVSRYENDQVYNGLIALDGTEKMPLNPSISEIKDPCKNMFVFSNGELYGVMNAEGQTLIPAKYKQLYFMAEDRLMAFDQEFKGKIIDLEDNQIGTYSSYVHLYPEAKYYSDLALAPMADTQWAFIDKEGKEAGKKQWYRAGGLSQVSNVENDFFDLKEMFQWLKITPNGVDGMTFASTSEEVQARETGIFYDNTGSSTSFTKKYRNRDIMVTTYMSGNLKARRGGEWQYTKATPVCFEINILDDDRCPAESQWKAFTELARTLGEEKIEVNGPFEVYQINEDTYAVVERRFETSIFFYLCKESCLKRVFAQNL